MTLTALILLLVLGYALTWRVDLAAPTVGPSRAVDRALHHASRQYAVPYWQLRSVSYCESRWNPNSVGNGSHGLFQFLRSTWARTPYGRRYIYSSWWNAHAAAWLVRHDGYSWREWTCKP